MTQQWQLHDGVAVGARDGKAYRIKGVVDAGSTAFPSDPMRGSVTWPADPLKFNSRNAFPDGPVSWPTDPMFIAFGS